MIFCPIIEIFPDEITRFATLDGRLILDIDEGTSVPLNKLLKFEDEGYTIGSIDDISLTIPNSPKNFFYLKRLFDPATQQPNNLHITVRISLGSETLYHDRLYCVSKSSASIAIRLVFSSNWKMRLKQLRVADLPLGTFHFTQTYVEQVKENNALYNDGDVGHWFPDVDYGGWREKGRIVVEDNRPLIHTLFILQKMFDEIEWCLEFPFYETELGRRCIDYILKDDYGDNENLKGLRRFNAQKEYLPNTVWTFGQIQGWNEFSDPGNSFDPATGIYDNVFEGKFKLNIQLTGSSTLIVLKFRMIKERINVGINEITILGEWNVPLFSTPSNNFFEVETTVTPSERVYLLVESEGLTSMIGSCLMKVNFSNEVTRTFFAKGDFIDLQAVVDQSMTCYDYLLGNIHFCAGIIDEYPQYKKVRVLSPFDANVFGDAIEGYFQNGFQNLRSKQPPDSTNSIVRNNDQLRYVKVAFAQTTDPVTEKLPQDSTELYSKTIDLGEPYAEDIEEIRNPLFEFTVLRPENNFVFQGNSSFGDPGYYMLPQMTDNTDGQVSLNIAPRKLIAYGYDEQFNVERGLIIWENTLITKIAFAAQEAGGIVFAGSQPTLKLIYGNTVNDLWSLVLNRFYIQFRSRLQMDFLVYLTHEEFFRFNNRNKFEIEYDGHPIVGRVLAINDYQPCNVISAQGILIPELLAAALCNDSEEDPTCANDPIIISTFNSSTNCWTFAIGGQLECNITQITWLINYESSDPPDSWENLGTGSTVEVCDVAEWFIIRAQIEYDCEECPPSDITLYVEPCSNDVNCVLSQLFNQNDFQQWIVYQLTGDTVNCEVTLTLEVFDEDGNLIEVIESQDGSFNQGSTNTGSGTWYFITPVTDNAFYILTVVVDCDNGCPDLETTCTYNTQGAPPPPEECDVDPILVCVPVSVMGLVCYTWVLENAGDYQYFVVTWTCQDGTSGQWMPGDPPVCCGGYIEANAMVHYCNCEPICTPFVNCDQTGCTIVEAGTPIPYIVCN